MASKIYKTIVSLLSPLYSLTNFKDAMNTDLDLDENSKKKLWDIINVLEKNIFTIKNEITGLNKNLTIEDAILIVGGEEILHQLKSFIVQMNNEKIFTLESLSKSKTFCDLKRLNNLGDKKIQRIAEVMKYYGYDLKYM